MPSTRHHVVALVTAPDLKTARHLARLALESRAAACANLIDRLESHYWWQGRIEQGQEVLLVFKTTRRDCGRLEALILREHPYDTPEFIVLPIAAGSKRYLDWIDGSVQAPPKPASARHDRAARA